MRNFGPIVGILLGIVGNVAEPPEFVQQSLLPFL